MEGNGCQVCFGITNRKSHDKFVKDVSELHSNIEVLGEYITSKDKISVRCTIDGYEWLASPNDLLAGYGCRQCASHGYNVGKTGYFYIYSFQNYCGFGITNTKKQRYNQHRTTFKQNKILAKLELIVKGDGKTILGLESHIKKFLPCFDTGIKGFKKEAVLAKDSASIYGVIEKYLERGEVSLEKI